MTEKIIGIAANEVLDSGESMHHLPVVYTPAGYVHGVQRAGGEPIVIPIGNPGAARFYISHIDKLILAGGQNVHPSYYHDTVKTDYDISYRPRDEFELALIREALAQHKAILGICRGMQILNIALGGSSNQKISTFSKINHLQSEPGDTPTHGVEFKTGTILQKIYGENARVNSFHRQAVERIGEGLEAIAWSEDGIVESVEDKKRRLLGIQWHPDFTYAEIPQEQEIFNYVVNNL